jgi:hypothetical protein
MSAGSLALAALALRRRRAVLVAGCQGLSLLALYPLWMTDAVGPYAAPPSLLAEVGRGPIVVAAIPDPPWEALPVPELGSRALIARWLAAQLHPAPGILHGLSYPLPPDVDGMVSPLLSATEARLARAGWRERVEWSRRLGARALVVHADPPLPGLRRATVADEAGAPAPHVYLVGGEASPEHRGGGRVRLLESTADRLILETDGSGGLVVLPRAYQEIWRARVEGSDRRLLLVPADGLFLGVQTPPGRARVEVRVGAWPEALAAVVALLAAVAALVVAVRGGDGAAGTVASAPR